MKKKFRIVSMLLTVVLLMSVFVTPVAAGQRRQESSQNNVQNIEKELPYAVDSANL
jgi:pentose-5-phosphate-3-epimerase